MQTVDILEDWWLFREWYSNEFTFPIRTFQKNATHSPARFFKNIFFHIRWKLCVWQNEKNWKLKRFSFLAKISKSITSNYKGKGDCNILSFDYMEVKVKVASWLVWLSTSFLAFGTTPWYREFVMYPMQRRKRKKKTSKPWLNTFRWPQMIHLLLFLLSKRTNACSRCGQTRSQDSGNQVIFITGFFQTGLLFQLFSFPAKNPGPLKYTIL